MGLRCFLMGLLLAGLSTLLSQMSCGAAFAEYVPTIAWHIHRAEHPLSVRLQKAQILRQAGRLGCDFLTTQMDESVGLVSVGFDTFCRPNEAFDFIFGKACFFDIAKQVHDFGVIMKVVDYFRVRG